MKLLETYPIDKRTGSLSDELIRIFGTIATRQSKLRQYTEAETAYQEVLKLAAQIENSDEKERAKLMATTYHNLGIVAQQQQQWEQACEYFLKALENYIAYNDTHNGGMALRSLARLWKASGDKDLPAAVATTLRTSVEETEKLLRDTLGEE